MKWIAELVGPKHVLEGFSFGTEATECYVQSRDGTWELSPALLKGVTSPEDARRKVDEILFGLNRYAIVFLGANSPIHLVVLRSIVGETRTSYVRVVDSMSASAQLVGMTIEHLDGRVEHGVVLRPKVEKLSAWMDLLRSDSNVQKVQRLLGDLPLDWANLSRIVEVIEGDVGGQHELIRRGYTSKEMRSLFGSTANNPAAAGDLARHGYSKEAPPKDPMTLEAARGYVLDMHRSWLESKLQIVRR